MCDFGCHFSSMSPCLFVSLVTSIAICYTKAICIFMQNINVCIHLKWYAQTYIRTKPLFTVKGGMKDEQKSAANMNYALRSDRQSLTMQVNWSIDFSTNKPRSVWIMSKRDDQLQKGTCLSTKWRLMSSWQAPWIVWLVWEKSITHGSLWSSRGQRNRKGAF